MLDALVMQQSNIWHNEPITVKRGDIWQLGKHRLLCGDSTNAQDVARLLSGEKVDLIFADPPYGIGIDTWDIAIADVPAFFTLMIDNLKHGGFFAFTHQMPYMVAWLAALESTPLRYKDHIAWVKRHASAPGAALMRSHESLFIYSNGKASYHKTSGCYTDVKLPGVMFDVIAIESVKVYINDLHAKLNGDPDRMRRTPEHSKYMLNGGYKGYQGVPGVSDRSPEYCNFTNVWSFVPENQRKRLQHDDKHTTGKPTLLMARLLELTTFERATVFDAFLGSGTTLISAEQTNRRCYGCELSEVYCAAIIDRWQQHTGRKAVKW
jgi:DNA modification methylase